MSSLCRCPPCVWPHLLVSPCCLDFQWRIRQNACSTHLEDSHEFFDTEPVLSIMKCLCMWETLGGPFSLASVLGIGLLLRHSQVKVSFLPEQWITIRGAREGKSSRNANDYLPSVSVLFSATDTRWLRSTADRGWVRGGERCPTCLCRQSCGFRNSTCKVLLWYSLTKSRRVGTRSSWLTEKPGSHGL